MFLTVEIVMSSYLICRRILRGTSAMNSLIEYIKIHLISLEQDKEKISINDEHSRCVVAGQIDATRHLLSVAEDMIE